MARSLAKDAIPTGWKYDLLDKFAIRCSGHTPSKSFPEYWDGGIKWISLADTNQKQSKRTSPGDIRQVRMTEKRLQ